MSAREVKKRGRPLAFLAMLAAGWIGLRVAVLAAWPQAQGASSARAEPLPVPVAALQVAEPVETSAAGTEIAEPDAAQQALAIAQPAALDAPPPADLDKSFDPLPAAAAHNALWMDASGAFGADLPPPVAAFDEPSAEEEF